MADVSLSEYRFTSIEKIERFEHWKRRQKEDLERLVCLQIDYRRRHAKILSFKGWARSWFDRDVRIEREQISWEVGCIDQEVRARERLLQSHPEKSSSQWNRYRLGY